MKKIFFILLCVFACRAQAQEHKSLILSDIHLNLETLNSRFDGVDADTVTFNTAINSIDNSAAYEYVLMPGDFIFHDPTHSDSCITRTLAYIAGKIHQRFPGAAIVPALGNNDLRLHNIPEPKAYELFYNSFLQGIDKGGAIKKTCNAGGYYSYKNKDLTIIALNTMLFVKECKEGDEEMKWFSAELAKCRGNAWVMYHIPPGINSFPKMVKNLDEQFWAARYRNEYVKLVLQHKNVIKYQLAGHTHMDDYRIIRDSMGNDAAYIHIAPALSTRNRNNPGYQVIGYTAGEKVPLDIKTYFKDSCCDWRLEYDFRDTYQEGPCAGFYKLITGNVKYKNLYEKYYDVSKPVLPAINAFIHWDEYIRDAVLEEK